MRTLHWMRPLLSTPCLHAVVRFLAVGLMIVPTFSAELTPVARAGVPKTVWVEKFGSTW